MKKSQPVTANSVGQPLIDRQRSYYYVIDYVIDYVTDFSGYSYYPEKFMRALP